MEAHNNIYLKLGIAIASKIYNNIFEIGKYMQETGADEFTNGGFWLYGYESQDCYLSDKFIKSLGYRRGEITHNVDFFYKIANNDHLNKGFNMLDELIDKKSESSFINYLDYTRKNGSVFNVECSGTVMYKFGEPYIILGTHEINQNDGYIDKSCFNESLSKSLGKI